jgi:photosystem II stability/assembly factor-like uncharacterized protein
MCFKSSVKPITIMKIISFFVLLTLLFVIQACKPEKEKSAHIDIVDFDLNLTNSLRGLSLVNNKVVWVSGTKNLFIKTIDGGVSWYIDSIKCAYALDFRSVKAFDENNAIVVSAGTPAQIYKTSDGGMNWSLCWNSDNPAVFLNAIDFWDDKNGLVMGDPVDGALFLLKTLDGGITWKRVSSESIPPSLEQEGGFAASGTCLTLSGKKHAWIGTGGDTARVYYSSDTGNTWHYVNTPLLSGEPMKGIYSLAFKNNLEGIAVGGEWNEEKPQNSKGFTQDGGQSWTLASGVDSYCSGSCFVKDDVFLACGQTGICISHDAGKTWEELNNTHLYGLAFDESGKVGFGTGPLGKIVKLKLVE